MGEHRKRRHAVVLSLLLVATGFMLPPSFSQENTEDSCVFAWVRLSTYGMT